MNRKLLTISAIAKSVLKPGNRSAALWSILFVLSANDLFGVLEIQGFKLKPFILVLPVIYFIAFFLGHNFPSALSHLARIAILPTLVFSGFELLSVYTHTSKLSFGLYITVVPIAFLTLALTERLAANLRFSVLRILIYSANATAWLGILQFFFSTLGFSFLRAADWWIYLKLPRVTGLAYEPSFYALTLTPFICALGVLSVSSRSSAVRRIVYWPLFSLGLALGFSSSRFSILMILVLQVLYVAFRSLRKSGPVHYRGLVPGLSGLFLAFFCLALLYPIIRGLNPEAPAQTFIRGTGIAGAYAGSVTERLTRFRSTLEIARQAPFFGVGLSNVPMEIWQHETQGAIEYKRNLYIPMNPIAELLAGWGFVGSLIFLVYLLSRMKVSALSKLGSRNRELAVALIMGTSGAFIVLNYNQNLFRLYLWLFFGLTIASLSRLKHLRAGRPAYQSQKESV